MKRSLAFHGLLTLALASIGLVALPAAATAAPAPQAEHITQLVTPDISVDAIKAHLQQFQTIANDNGGNRRSTSAGYDASVDYVYDTLVAAGYSVTKQACTSGCASGAGPNVIADWPGGDPNQVLMLGAHLDGVSAGPGINDNGSGSAMLLEIALTLAQQDPSMSKHVRFAWWTDEEQGLNGSQFYANNLSSAERSTIIGYLNFDMVASTNGGYFINRLSSSLGQTLAAYYTSIGIDTDENTEGAGRSDDASFNAVGIETSGVAAGASYTKTSTQAAKWGGTAGQSYDPCYHSSCDTYPSNINTTILDHAGDASAYAVWTLAVGAPQGDDFSVAVSPSSASVDPGDSATATVSTTLTNGSAQTVNLSASGLPTGTTATFSPSSVTSNGGSSTMTVNTSASTPVGTYTITITGTGSSATRTTPFTLTVNGPPGCSGTNGTDVTIPDNTTVESPITISGCAGNASATSTVEVHIVHTWIGDLVVNLVAPDGSTYLLHNRTGSSTDNINQTYTVNLSGEAANGTWKLRVQDAAGGDTGRIDTWTLNLAGGGGPGTCTGTNDTNVNIPDPGTVESPITISGCSGTASATSTVEVHIVHTYRGDLIVNLVAPDGSTYLLHNGSGSSADNLDQTYTVNLSSEQRNGTWKLRVQDRYSWDSGYINSWTLTL